MKKIILMLSFSIISTAVFAQEPTQAQQDCMDKGLVTFVKKTYADCKITGEKARYNIIKNSDLIGKFTEKEQECITAGSAKYSADIEKLQEECFK